MVLFQTLTDYIQSTTKTSVDLNISKFNQISHKDFDERMISSKNVTARISVYENVNHKQSVQTQWNTYQILRVSEFQDHLFTNVYYCTLFTNI